MMTSPALPCPVEAVDVIAPNFKRRHSGVTSTILRLVPLQARHVRIASCGPGLPEDVPRLSPWQLICLSRRPRIWHARRNIEMLAGLALKYGLGKRLHLVFTSAAQRRHTAYTRWLIRQQDAVIATSHKAARYLEHPANVILHGIDCTTFRPAADKRALRIRLGLPAEGLLIGCFGRIRPQKGTDLFIETAIRALADHPQAHALVMGRTTAKHRGFLDTLKARVTAAELTERIHFRDEVPIADLADHFRALDLYIAPQRWEGFGLTPLEAMASGVAVIATRTGAFEEMIAAGQTGLLIPADDAAVMHAATATLLAAPDRLRDMGQAARKHTEAYFTLKAEAQAIIYAYRQLMPV